MIRLTLLLLAVIGVTMIVAGRELSPEEKAALARPGAAAAQAADEAPPAAGPRTAPSEDQLIDAAARAADEAPLPLPDAAPEEPPADPAGSETGPEAGPETGPEAGPETGTFLYVSGSRVNVRSGPSTAYDVVGQALFGQAAEVLGPPEDGWIRIRIDAARIEGYIAEQFLRPERPGG